MSNEPLIWFFQPQRLHFYGSSLARNLGLDPISQISPEVSRPKDASEGLNHVVRLKGAHLAADDMQAITGLDRLIIDLLTRELGCHDLPISQY